jgi:hypothetical protein
MGAPKRHAAGTGRTTPKETKPARPTGTPAGPKSGPTTRPTGFHGRDQQVRQTQHQPLPQRRGARGNR